MGKKVLLYEFKGIRLGQVHKALEKLPFEIRVVERQEYWMTLGYPVSYTHLTLPTKA